MKESTLERAENMGISVSLIDEWYNVDTWEYMMRLKRDLEKPLNGSFHCENTYGMMAGKSLDYIEAAGVRSTRHC